MENLPGFCQLLSCVGVIYFLINMFWFVAINVITRVACAYDYYSDIDWSSSNQHQQYQKFNPSSKYDNTYPVKNIYDYALIASNFVEPEDLLAAEALTNEDIDRQVSNPIEEVAPVIGGLTPFIAASAFILGISALFANIVNLNSTASNSSVPFGLWALPELPQITNFSLPNIGRKKREVNEVSWYENVYDLNNEVDEDLEASTISKLVNVLAVQKPESIFKGFKKAILTFALLDDNAECQAALGCRYGKQLRDLEMLDKLETLNSVLDFMQPFKWDTFTTVFSSVIQGSHLGRDCSHYDCKQCLTIIE